MRGRVGVASALLMAVMLTAGCAALSTSTTSHYVPAEVSTPTQSTEPKVVTFTEEAAKRVGLTTVPAGAEGALIVVPSAALIYEKSGASLVFVSPKPLSYHRVKVVVVRDNGTNVWLSSGPGVGTAVVTIGANQVWGAEQGVGH